jgi:sphingomyelin phosphodiesterase acid-like 3
MRTVSRRWAPVRIWLALWGVMSLGLQPSPAQTAAPRATPHASPSPVHVVLISDIHFEPFWDPGKVPQLAAAPPSRWKAIFASAASPDRDAQWAALEQKCPARGSDTAYALYAATLKGIGTIASDAKFITVSGDLISHAFPCKFRALVPNAEPGAYRNFVEKTIEFVLGEVHKALPKAYVYPALGNNDSDCADYQLDEGGTFLSDLAAPISKGLPIAASKSAAETFADAGYYSAPLPAPLAHTRLLVLDNTFMSRRFKSCSGTADSAGADAQIAWLRDQLSDARRHGEHVWVMGHIPPGIDPYSTALKLRNVCGGSAPEMFLSSDDLPNLLAEYGDVIQLALFAHTHMDEMRFLKPNGEPASSAHPGVAVKLVPSISPINGNAPSFTVASVDPSTAQLADYRVFVQDETGTSWKQEYDFDRDYRQTAFSASTLKTLTSAFASDPAGATGPSNAYLRNYFVRDRSAELRLFWSQYTCALSAYSVGDYRSCICSPHPNP